MMIGIVLFLLMIGIILYLIPSFKDKIKDKLLNIYREMKWNGTIGSLTISYLKIAIFVSLKIQNEFSNLK